jgi:hypothetical protein
VVLKGRGDQLAAAGRLAVDQDDDRDAQVLRLDRARLETLLAPLAALHRGDEPAVVQEQTGDGDRLVEEAAGAPAQVEDQAAQPPAGAQGGQDLLQLVGRVVAQRPQAHLGDAPLAVQPVVPAVVLQAGDPQHVLRAERLAHQRDRARLPGPGGPHREAHLGPRLDGRAAPIPTPRRRYGRQPAGAWGRRLAAVQPDEGLRGGQPLVLVVDVGDAVAGLQACPLRRAARHDRLDDQRPGADVVHELQPDAEVLFADVAVPRVLGADDGAEGVERPHQRAAAHQEGAVALKRLVLAEALARLQDDRRKGAVLLGALQPFAQPGGRRHLGRLVQPRQGRLGQLRLRPRLNVDRADLVEDHPELGFVLHGLPAEVGAGGAPGRRGRAGADGGGRQQPGQQQARERDQSPAHNGPPCTERTDDPAPF